jgi:hypothetical protein
MPRQIGGTPIQNLASVLRLTARSRICAVVFATMVATASADTTMGGMSFADFEAAYEATQLALDRHQFDDALRSARVLLAVAPHNPSIELAYARAAAGAQRPQDALRTYAAVVAQGFGAAVARDSGFAALPHSGGWRNIRRRAHDADRRVGKSESMFDIPDEGAIPEGLAFDPATDRFFVTSTYQRKVLVRHRDHGFADFVSSKDHGLLQALGVRVDQSGRRLLVCSGADDNRLVDFVEADRGRSGIFVYDLDSGHLVQRAWVSDPGPHLFNDLAQAPDGEVYVTDSRAGRIYEYNVATGILRPIPADGPLVYPNGIAIDPPGEHLFIADQVGISRLDLRSTRWSRLQERGGISSAGIDGLYFIHGELVGVQSIAGVDRIVALRLDAARTAITAVRPILQGDPNLKGATEGVVVGSYLYFIANSQQDKFDEQGRLDVEHLHRSRVLRVRI